MKKVFASLFIAAVALVSQASQHRFYADEGLGANYSPEDVVCNLDTRISGNVETLVVTIKNCRHTPFQPLKAGIELGIDTYMDHYPEWNDKFFPTLMMCEPRHFYGYLQSPSGRMKAVASADAVASWSLDYNLGYQDPAPHWFMGHRVKSLRIDLLAALPLPAHHPQNLWQLLPGEERTWTLKIIDINNPDDFEATVSRECDIPMLHLDNTSSAPGGTIAFEVYGNKPAVTIDGAGVKLSPIAPRLWQANYKAAKPGLYNVVVTDGDKTAHGCINVHFPWRNTMELARKAALRYKQKATSHVESWYGFHSAFIAARYFPCDSIDRKLNERFDMIFGNLYDANGKPLKYEWRIQNTASTIGMLVDRYEAFGNIADLDRARNLADWMISFSQKANGAYMNGSTVYSSVIYPAKSILELVDAEKLAGRKKDARRHEL